MNYYIFIILIQTAIKKIEISEIYSIIKQFCSNLFQARFILKIFIIRFLTLIYKHERLIT